MKSLTGRRAVTLAWRGKTLSRAAEGSPVCGRRRARETRPPEGRPESDAPLRRVFWTDDNSGLIHDDNLAALRALAETHRERVTLAYMDPPFLTNRVHDARVDRSRKRVRGDRAHNVVRVAFDDRWQDRAAYLDALAPRLAAIRELLAPHGSLVIHVDPKMSHYVKVLADEIFGADAFASEIVWRYRRWPSKTPNFQRVHDVLLRYRKDPRAQPRWNPLYEPLAASTLATWGTTKQRAVFAPDGRRARSSSTDVPTEGVPMGDVWEIGVIAPVSRERTGYPSQKPEALLERIVRALSDPGDLVLDPYAGSGTSLAVAARLGRSFLGIDESAVAVETTRRRLAKVGLVLRAVSPSAPFRRALRHDLRHDQKGGDPACVTVDGKLRVSSPGSRR